MRLTEGQAKILGRRQQQPVREPGDLLAVFVPGKLVNPLNATAWIWQKRSRMAKQWKERTWLAVLEIGWPMMLKGQNPHAPTPKTVTFTACTWNTMDTDGLAASIKPVRDALIQCGVIHDDGPASGHEFLYRQRIDRARRGVEIRVKLAAGPPARDTEA